MEQKKGFISYSWTSAAHEDWVTILANRLVQDGVDLKYDKWDLKEGHDKYTFMESMVNSKEIEKVLIVLDKKYCEKANERKGGVGTETLIITTEVYESAVQEKFIPIVTEVDEEGKAFLPAYLKGRIYIDLSDPDHFEANYEKLLRNIFNRPSLSKPKIGAPPKYLYEDTPFQFKTTTLVRGFDAQIDKHPNRINSLLRDFLDEFRGNLSEFTIDVNSTAVADVGADVLDKLTQYGPLRNDYIQFLNKLLRADLPFDSDIILHFFEKLPMLFGPDENRTELKETWRFKHFKLIVTELFLYTVAIALQNHNYSLLEDIFHSKYLVEEYGYTFQREPENFTALRFHYDLIDDYYKKVMNQNYYSVHAHLIVSRIPEAFSKEDLLKADLLCFYISQLYGWRWFPSTYIYRSEYSSSFEFLNRLASRKHFDKVKGVLGFETPQALKDRIIEIGDKWNDRGYDSGFAGRIPAFEGFIKIDNIGTAK